MQRTHNCGELRKKDIGKAVYLYGWVSKIRNKGSIIWIDLRDVHGITQLVVEDIFHTQSKDKKKNNFPEDIPSPKASEEENLSLFKLARSLGREYVIEVKGKVIERISKNDGIATGDIEILVENLNILNRSHVPPFTLIDDTDGGEELRMKYRYLDIRRPVIKENLLLRHKIIHIFRNILNDQHFIEVETPLLIRSTPEGARDFVVPSRMHSGKFYALPQSPQIFKQLLMIGGLDRYYQIARCFRDEDLRADRQPEFSQLDCELSFVTQEDIIDIFEKIVRQVFNLIKDIILPQFDRLTYDDAISTYGTDKPDLRFGMPIVDITSRAQKCNFKLFDVSKKVCGICIKGGASFTRKQIDNYTTFVKRPDIGAKGLIYIKYNEEGIIKSSIDKFVTSEQIKTWFQNFKAEKGDLIFIIPDESGKSKANIILGKLRLKIAADLELTDKNKFAPLWITDFPLFENNEELDRLTAVHHPFTSPRDQDIELFNTNPLQMKAKAYDLVINGHEIAGGSIRISDKAIQEKMFGALGISMEEAYKEFGFLIKALEYGAPPHGGIAFGIARLCAILKGSDAIRDFIAFPKNNSGKDVMINSPSEISLQQLRDLDL